MKSGRASWQKEEEKIFQYCTDSSGEILYLEALQGHSGRNPIDPSFQDNVLIPDNFFEYIYHIGCAINLHSITNSGLIPGGHNLSKRQAEIRIKLTWTHMVHAETVEETSKHDVLGRHKTCPSQIQD